MNDLEHRLTTAMNAAADEADIDVDAWHQNQERLSRPSSSRHRPAVAAAAGLAVAAVAALIAVAAWPSNHRSAIPAGPTPAPSMSHDAPTPTPTFTAIPPPPLPSGTTPTSISPSSADVPTAVTNETVTPAVRAALEDAYSAGTHTPRSQITGTRPGSVFYAFDSATQTYWAVAELEFTGPVVAEQDGGSYGIFSKVTSGQWQLVGQGELFPLPKEAVVDCRVKLPTRVMQAWSWDITKPTCGS